MNKDKLKSIIESLLFLWGDAISFKDMIKTLDLEEKELKEILEEMIEDYKKDYRGIRLVETNGFYQLSTKPENYEFIKGFVEEKNKKNISRPSLETLSIIAYKQPVTKIEIENLRGVNCDSTLKALLDLNLIEISGTLDRIGHPKLYSTTDYFLKKFGIKNLSELPNLEEFENFEDLR